MAKIKYTDIGHSDKNDVLWIWDDDALQLIAAGQSRTHELVWGGDMVIYEHWKGRYDQHTAYCSITPPQAKLGQRRPPTSILDALKRQFSIVRFYYFTDGVDSFSPNPKDEKRR